MQPERDPQTKSVDKPSAAPEAESRGDSASAGPVHSIDALAENLRVIGLREGDAVLMRAAVKKMGAVRGSAAKALIEAMQRVLGPEGTILGLAFTKTFLLPRRHADYVFDRAAPPPPTTGGFAAALSSMPGAVRSAHPTNGFVGVGAKARWLLEDHDETKPCFFPLEKLIASGGKMALVGCINDSPGFSTVHLVQEHLGLSTKSIMGPVQGVLYKKPDGALGVFRKWDIPGCSAGFDQFYGHYIKAGVLKVGKVGDADSLGISAEAAYGVEMALIKANPRFPLCTSPTCEFCRGSLLYNLRDMPGFYARSAVPLLRRVLKSM